MRSVVCAVLVVYAHVLGGCGGQATQLGSQPSWRSSEFRADSARASDWIVFQPSSDAASHYNQPNAENAKSTRAASLLLPKLAALIEDNGFAHPRPDARLSKVAGDLAPVVPADGPPPYKLIEFAMHRHGLIEPSPLVIIVRGANDDDAIVRELAKAIANAQVSSGPFSRMGVGQVMLGRGRGSVTLLALQHSFVVTNPIPRRLSKSGTTVLEGHILEPFTDPQIQLTRQDGSVVVLKSKVKGSKRFRATIRCSTKAGRQQVEITASDRSGATVLANFPLWCAMQPETSIRLAATTEASVVSARDAEGRLLKLINRERRHHNLRPVVLDRRVAEVARAHSSEMLSTGQVVHVSERTGTAADRLRAASIYNTAVMENVARAYGIKETHEGLMNSPGHRGNILSPLATHAGVGVALGEQVANRRELYVTQLFTRVPPKISLSAVRAKIENKVQSNRNLVHDPRLSKLAAGYVTEIARGVPPAQVSLVSQERQSSIQRAFRGLTTMTTTVEDIETFDIRQATENRSMSHYGLAVARGASSGRPTFHIVVILAETR